MVDASKLGEDTKIGGLKKTVLSDQDVKKIVKTFRENEVIEDFSVAVPYEDFEAKGYSFSAGQYFDIKIEYEDISEDEFNKRLSSYKSTLKGLFDEGKALQDEILTGIDKLSL